MKDGLYQVTTDYLCAGFVVENGQVTDCAPILRRNINHWITQGEHVPDNDPFASAAADEAQAETQPEAPAESPFDTPPANAPTTTQEAPISNTTAVRPVAQGDGKVVLTFKGGLGFDAPWIVIHAADLQDAADQITGSNAALLAQTMEQVQKAGAHFASLAPAKATQNTGSAPQQQQQRAPQQEAPGGQEKFCAHGAMQFRSGVSAKTGKAWKGFFCPTPKGTPNQCSAEFIR